MARRKKDEVVEAEAPAADEAVAVVGAYVEAPAADDTVKEKSENSDLQSHPKFAKFKEGVQ